ncbi:MAG: hypothetical protein ACYCVZ_08005 [Streptosporangiaceae bacterium]
MSPPPGAVDVQPGPQAFPGDGPETCPDAAGAARVFPRPMGSPLPLGFAALAAGTFTVAGLQLSWIPASQWHLIGLVL